ncbi:hypothetical protein PR202_ga07892 [Eleusine coracana subsp. coracana]|uniref:Uncharacterized protein n=1 Tax=Eleusine coracana subsp. coracana TaxID=191504 RepID=A0AAV5BYN7_ELECO|nr:hypothetical protein PR202_ga07892 [Eleusine coracana subsp. coracana]
MEAVVRKVQQRLRKVREEMERWDDINTRLVDEFSQATAVISRLQVLGEDKNYGVLRGVPGIREDVVGQQMEVLELIFVAMGVTLENLNGISKTLNKALRDTNQMVRTGSALTAKQMQLQVGILPTIAQCLDGLQALCEMHQADSSDIAALHQLLVDQPNIPKDEVQSIFDVVFADQIC